MTNQSNAPVIKEVMLDAPSQKVWEAITDKKKMKEWYFDVSDFKPEVGFEFTFEGGDPKGDIYVHLCKVTEVIPGRKLVHSWRYQGYEGNSFVSWELFPEGDKTKLVLTHTGLDTFPADNKAFARENFNMGWTEITGTNLPQYLAKN